ncbi:Methyl-accepting chemotaxis protein 4 [Ascidiaceihabitans donghaensis]|uniref:Methyl-accepting chemotaxis protein 4 n=1 Tax=Ascidiaceihabitans donghaensis TaxID=1510460 RepID=A0A2R8BE01_9RHOB|nr:methyl-accepting chemotaxis protein [Ascidiaceihabitans donghaensis]SPH21296.1 Methyl-accepting chemotaxis protein 4 [Ascidiaceihabitans donghaensis]
MSHQNHFPNPQHMTRLGRAASTLGFEIVDIAGFLDLVEAKAQQQRADLGALSSSAQSVVSANSEAKTAIAALADNSGKTYKDVQNSAETMREAGEKTRDVAQWVQKLEQRTGAVSDTLQAVKKNNAQIASISTQVNTLAINAKIEAARAGDSGRGFAVVANAINELSHDTKNAAAQISTNIEELTKWIASLGIEAKDISTKASDVLEQSTKTDNALGRMELSVRDANMQASQIASHASAVESSLTDFGPRLDRIQNTVDFTVSGIEETHTRIQNLIDTSESMVQSSAALGGVTEDQQFIDYVQSLAAEISQALASSIDEGAITSAELFDRSYVPIINSDPVQVMTKSTLVMDKVLPRFQEAALDFDHKVVFCAAIDVNGYLPTHNRKFSHPQGDDPVWNMANCRNRRIFDDRVGLKAGRNTAPFLLQVYRRDMGGGNFVMMKDLSAPISILGKHWGGLRLAYTF